MNVKKEYPIRVLCAFSTLDRGGAESMCMNLYRHIDREKVQFDFVKHTHNIGDFEDEIIKLGGRIFEAPRFYEYNLIAYKKWWKQHLRNHPEHKIIHGHYFSISDVFLQIAQDEGRITIGHSHSTETPSEQIEGLFLTVKDILYRKHVSRIEKYSDYCFACSEVAGKWIFKNKPVKVLNNAIDAELYKFNSEARNKIRQELGIEKYFVLGTVGRIMTQKNPLGIVDIFSEVCKLRDDARLLWVGTYDTDMGRKAMQHAEELGIRDKIIFTGVVDNVYEMVQAMDCFIFPSFYEGLGIVAVEAQTAGLPCFISDVVPREVELTELCTFLPLGDYSRWAEEIIKYDYSNRKTYHERVADVGYDIATTAKWLQYFYLSL